MHRSVCTYRHYALMAGSIMNFVVLSTKRFMISLLMELLNFIMA